MVAGAPITPVELGYADWLVFAPSVDGGTRIDHQAAGRPVHVLKEVSEFRSFLFKCVGSSITFIAPWRELTVQVLRLLAEWAAESADRGCAVSAIEIPVKTGIASANDYHPEVAVFSTVGCRILKQDGVQEESEAGLLKRVGDTWAPLGTVFCGHGSEFCVSLGSRWLSTTECAKLGGPIITPGEIKSSVAFLNTCSGMRLGDSVVPLEASLAASLAAQGSSVIGSYRNMTPIDGLADVFGAGLAGAMPLGQVTNLLNRQYMDRMREPAAFMLLGDAAHVVQTGAKKIEFARDTVRHPIEHKTLVCELGWLIELDQQITRWNLIKTRADQARKALDQISCMVFRSADVSAWAMLSGQERRNLLSVAEEAALNYRRALAEDLTDWISNEGWIQGVYATCSRRRLVAQEDCPRCGERLLRYEYSQWGPRGDCVFSEECDRCGSVMEWIGLPPSSRNLQAEVHPTGLDVKMSPLADKDRNVGMILIHRAKNSPVYPWPDSGLVRFNSSDWPFRGRATVAALILEKNSLSIQYVNVFFPV